MSASDLAERLDAVERALTDDETDLSAVRETAAIESDVERLETRIDDLEAAVEEIDAAVEAVRGYAGNVRAVNRDVERRASAALAKAEALEATLDERDGRGAEHTPVSAGDRRPDDRSRNNRSSTDRSTDGQRRDAPASNGQGSDGQASSGGISDAPVPNERESAGETGSRRHDQAATAAGAPTERVDSPRDRARSRAADAREIDGEPSARDDENETEKFIERVRDAL